MSDEIPVFDGTLTWSEAILLCRACDSFGVTRSLVTGARGRCRHPLVAYRGHEPEA